MDILRPLITFGTYSYYQRRDGLHPGIHRRLLDRTQMMPEDELDVFRNDRLKQILTYCGQHNAFYRDRFGLAGFDPSNCRGVDDLSRLPVLTKDDIRSAGDTLFSEGYDRANTIHKRTGGSTGVPLHVYWDYGGASFKRAGTMRHDRWAGLVPGTRLAAVWGDTSRRPSLKQRIRNALTDRAFYLDTLTFDDEHIERFLALVRARKPEILMGHAHSLFRLAEYVRDKSKGELRVKAIISTSMVLQDVERSVIEEVFRSPVFDRYGCEEIGVIASECDEHSGMHVFAEGLIVEIGGGGEEGMGPLIITDLVNRAMPLIRYEIGDYAAFLPGRCGCGRTLPRLRQIVGRTADFLYTPDRTPVFGISVLDTFVIHIPGFKQVQILQESYDHLRFSIVRGDGFGADSLEQLKRNVLDVFGPKMRYDVVFVDQIEMTERGKFRFSICRIGERDGRSNGAPGDGDER